MVAPVCALTRFLTLCAVPFILFIVGPLHILFIMLVDLVASLAGLDPTDFVACENLERGACGIPFEIVAVDPETMTTLGPVYSTEGYPMGAGTVGLQVGNELFVGSFKGDRILRIDLSPKDAAASAR